MSRFPHLCVTQPDLPCVIRKTQAFQVFSCLRVLGRSYEHLENQAARDLNVMLQPLLKNEGGGKSVARGASVFGIPCQHRHVMLFSPLSQL